VNKLAALKAMIEFSYSNDNLFEKIMLDHGLTTSDTYAATDRQDVDMCLADVYLHLATHPDYNEGGQSVKFPKKELLAARQRLYAKYGARPPEFASRPKTISGERFM